MNSDLAQLFVNGIAVGSIIALAAVGLTLTNGILRLPNFAHGDFLTLGAYMTFLLDTQILSPVIGSQETKIWIAILLASGLTILAFLLSEYLIWRPMRNRRTTSTTLIIISIGLALFVRNGIIFIWGGGNQGYDLPVETALAFGPVQIPYYRLVVIGLAIAAVLGLHFCSKTPRLAKPCARSPTIWI